jgi:chaperonin GroES
MRDNIIQEEFMTIKPMGDRVLVKMEEVQEKTAGGIFIPQTAQEKTQIADVVAVGDDESITVKKGDKVMYDKYAGTSVKADGQEYLILHMSDVLAVIS